MKNSAIKIAIPTNSNTTAQVSTRVSPMLNAQPTERFLAILRSANQMYPPYGAQAAPTLYHWRPPVSEEPRPFFGCYIREMLQTLLERLALRARFRLRSWYILDLRQFWWSAYQRRFTSNGPARRLDAGAKNYVCNMGAVPRQQILHSVNSGGSNMNGISSRTSWNWHGPRQFFGQFGYFVSLI
jgi:hypothetical protein